MGDGWAPMTARVDAGTTTSGRSWSGWMAGGSSTSLARTPAAGRRRRLRGVGTEGPSGPGKVHGLETGSPSGRTAGELPRCCGGMLRLPLSPASCSWNYKPRV